LPGERGGNGHLIEEKTCCVVDETLAFEHGDEPRWKRIAIEDGFRGDGIRRRDDCAQRKAGGPRQRRREDMHGDGDRDRGERNGSQHERQDAQDLATEVRPRGVERTRHQQRRQHCRQHQVGVHVDGRVPSHQRDGGPAEQQYHRGRNGYALGNPCQYASTANEQQDVMK
jgi:hypothetical protein